MPRFAFLTKHPNVVDSRRVFAKKPLHVLASRRPVATFEASQFSSPASQVDILSQMALVQQEGKSSSKKQPDTARDAKKPIPTRPCQPTLLLQPAYDALISKIVSKTPVTEFAISNAYTVKQLKDILRFNKIRVTGRKTELVTRVFEACIANTIAGAPSLPTAADLAGSDDDDDLFATALTQMSVRRKRRGPSNVVAAMGGETPLFSSTFKAAEKPAEESASVDSFDLFAAPSKEKNDAFAEDPFDDDFQDTASVFATVRRRPDVDVDVVEEKEEEMIPCGQSSLVFMEDAGGKEPPSSLDEQAGIPFQQPPPQSPSKMSPCLFDSDGDSPERRKVDLFAETPCVMEATAAEELNEEETEVTDAEEPPAKEDFIEKTVTPAKPPLLLDSIDAVQLKLMSIPARTITVRSISVQTSTDQVPLSTVLPAPVVPVAAVTGTEEQSESSSRSDIVFSQYTCVRSRLGASYSQPAGVGGAPLLPSSAESEEENEAMSQHFGQAIDEQFSQFLEDSTATCRKRVSKWSQFRGYTLNKRLVRLTSDWKRPAPVVGDAVALVIQPYLCFLRHYSSVISAVERQSGHRVLYPPLPPESIRRTTEGAEEPHAHLAENNTVKPTGIFSRHQKVDRAVSLVPFMQQWRDEPPNRLQCRIVDIKAAAVPDSSESWLIVVLESSDVPLAWRCPAANVHHSSIATDPSTGESLSVCRFAVPFLPRLLCDTPEHLLPWEVWQEGLALKLRQRDWIAVPLALDDAVTKVEWEVGEVQWVTDQDSACFPGSPYGSIVVMWLQEEEDHLHWTVAQPQIDNMVSPWDLLFVRKASPPYNNPPTQNSLAHRSDVDRILPVLTWILHQPGAFLMEDPPDDEDAPDYDTIIKHPIGLKEVLRKAKRTTYASFSRFRTELLTVFNNALVWNPARDLFFLIAKVLKEQFLLLEGDIFSTLEPAKSRSGRQSKRERAVEVPSYLLPRTKRRRKGSARSGMSQPDSLAKGWDLREWK